MIVVFSLLLLLLVHSCDKDENHKEIWLNNIEALLEHNLDKISIDQGVAGTVVFIRGNCMPGAVSDTTPEHACRRYPVQRTVRIHEITHRSKSEHVQGGFHRDVKTNLVASIQTDREGFFEIDLPPGKYSVFVEEENLLYANLWDGQGFIQPVTVNEGQATVIRINIDHLAYY